MITIHAQTEPAINRFVDFHRRYVGEAHGLNDDFETHIREALTKYISTFNAACECLWLAETNGQLVGTIAVVAEAEAVARVRWLLVHPDHQANNLEHELLGQAVRFCVGKYTKVYL
jgi:GNAT superfamily N-acetyltransferase